MNLIWEEKYLFSSTYANPSSKGSKMKCYMEFGLMHNHWMLSGLSELKAHQTEMFQVHRQH
jgi:hypothetical protein